MEPLGRPLPGPSIPAWRSQRPPASLLPPPAASGSAQTPFVNVRACTWRPETGRAAWPGPPRPEVCGKLHFAQLSENGSHRPAPRPRRMSPSPGAPGRHPHRWLAADAPVVGPATARRPSRAAGGHASCPRAPAQHVPRLEPPVGLPAQLRSSPRSSPTEQGPRGLAPHPGTAPPPTELLMQADLPRAHLAGARAGGRAQWSFRTQGQVPPPQQASGGKRAD